MKLSVSVPDALWDAAQAKYPTLSTSAIVQKVLKADITDEELLAQGDAIVAREIARIRSES